jgi:hypothetical protein
MYGPDNKLYPPDILLADGSLNTKKILMDFFQLCEGYTYEREHFNIPACEYLYGSICNGSAKRYNHYVASALIAGRIAFDEFAKESIKINQAKSDLYGDIARIQALTAINNCLIDQMRKAMLKKLSTCFDLANVYETSKKFDEDLGAERLGKLDIDSNKYLQNVTQVVNFILKL